MCVCVCVRMCVMCVVCVCILPLQGLLLSRIMLETYIRVQDNPICWGSWFDASANHISPRKTKLGCSTKSERKWYDVWRRVKMDEKIKIWCRIKDDLAPVLTFYEKMQKIGRLYQSKVSYFESEPRHWHKEDQFILFEWSSVAPTSSSCWRSSLKPLNLKSSSPR